MLAASATCGAQRTMNLKLRLHAINGTVQATERSAIWMLGRGKGRSSERIKAGGEKSRHVLARKARPAAVRLV